MQNVICGFHAIEEALRAGKGRGTLYVSRKSSRIESLTELARQKKVTVKHAGDDILTKLAGKNNEHRGAVYVQTVVKKKFKDVKEFIDSVESQPQQNSLVLVLDGITDPQNLGAIMRSADQFGVDLVVLPERRSARINTTVNKTSAGASSYVPTVVVKNLRRSLSELKEAAFWVYGADAEGQPLHEVDFADRAVLVMGAEGKGLSRLILEECDLTAAIPTAGYIDSLNVSVAAGIILYELRRP